MFATETMERNLLLIALVTLSFAAVLEFVHGNRQRPRAIVTVSLLAVTTVVLLCAVLSRWLREGQGPFLTLYDVLLSNLFTLNLIYLIIYMFFVRTRASAVVVLPFFVLLGVWLMNLPSAAVPLPATFDNPWLWMHVLSGKLFLGFSLVPAALGIHLPQLHADCRSSLGTRRLGPILGVGSTGNLGADYLACDGVAVACTCDLSTTAARNCLGVGCRDFWSGFPDLFRCSVLQHGTT